MDTPAGEEGGDDAVRELTRRLDGVELEEIEVPHSAVSDAYDLVPSEVVEALKLSARRVREFHEASRPRGWMDRGRGYGAAVNPVGSVGAYIPGGTASYPSTVLMTVIPARVAGVEEVSVCTPAGRGGAPPPVVLAAAGIAGADRIYRIGGAQAIAAMAYGTESVRRQDMICGPGNLFVTLAKKLLFGDVGIDGLYGPTETVIVADESANPTLCAADLLAQAEHDVLAAAVLITTSEGLADAVRSEVELRLRRLERGVVARAAMENRGCIAIVDSLREALDLVNDYAPEHLSLMVQEPSQYVDRVRNAGRNLPGGVLPRGSGRLRRGAESRHAHGRHGQVQLRAWRTLLREGQPHRRAGRRRAAGADARRLRDSQGGGLHGPRGSGRDSGRAHRRGELTWTSRS